MRKDCSAPQLSLVAHARKHSDCVVEGNSSGECRREVDPHCLRVGPAAYPFAEEHIAADNDVLIEKVKA
jgi:hypothetical protein